MNDNAVPWRTGKGESELHHRTHQIGRNLRVALILVDGRSTIRQLVQEKGAGLPDVKQSLCQLLEEGFLAIGDDETGSDLIESARAELIAVARELLGDDGKRVVAQLQEAPADKEAILAVVDKCKKLVKLAIDESKAEQLFRRCRGIIDRL